MDEFARRSVGDRRAFIEEAASRRDLTPIISQTYVRGIIFHTNFAESYHSLLKRGIIGTVHHVSDKHLPRYLAEVRSPLEHPQNNRWGARRFGPAFSPWQAPDL
jgi:ISXO2-like transposase domain